MVGTVSTSPALLNDIRMWQCVRVDEAASRGTEVLCTVAWKKAGLMNIWKAFREMAAEARPEDQPCHGQGGAREAPVRKTI